MTSNYIIHIGNNIINKRIKIKEFLNKYERKILEKNASAFFYLLINLLFNLSIDRFRLVINRKYIFFKKKKRIDLVFNITKKLLARNNIDIKEKKINYFLDNIKKYNDTYTTSLNTMQTYPNNSMHEICCSYNDINNKKHHLPSNTILINNSYTNKKEFFNKIYNSVNEKKENITHYNIISNVLLNNNQEFVIDKKFIYDNYFCENYNTHNIPISQIVSLSNNSATLSPVHDNTYVNFVDHYKKNDFNNKDIITFPLNSYYLQNIKNKFNEYKIKTHENYLLKKYNKNVERHFISARNTTSSSSSSISTTCYNNNNNNDNNNGNNNDNNNDNNNGNNNGNNNDNNNGNNNGNNNDNNNGNNHNNNHNNNNSYNSNNLAYDKQNNFILIKKKKQTKINKYNINIFDEFLDIYLLFRLRGDASRSINGHRILIDKVLQTSDILLKKKQQEQILIEKLNSSHIINNNTSDEEKDFTLSNNQNKSVHDFINHKNHITQNEESTTYTNQTNSKLHDMILMGMNKEKQNKVNNTNNQHTNNNKIKKKNAIQKNDTSHKNYKLKSIDNMYNFL
ncbi:hypothetical protein PFMC_01283 [Plasmodium falciparum CAMP/Malaysia]|uniref:Uncharacterized protein n=1 Tax=Plasmodium falciparum (isolate Camp / Malaysia) TaxID=5835 RepID=A0A024XB19_PLAFC|nr:hypothetical protein PFMC_01283 [Plasmodium falciparum CAMP/Malaysia]